LEVLVSEDGTEKRTGVVHSAKSEIDCWIKFDEVERLGVYDVVKRFCIGTRSLTKIRSSLQEEGVVI
jgi:hypothetical protein